MQKLKLKDDVVLLSGKDKGKKGKVLSINFKTNRVVVEGVNKIKKSLKPTQENPTGGFSDKEASVHISKVALVSPKTGKPSRVKIVSKGDKKVRVLVACGTELK
jgi:large subunit ribosomal protein L24